MWLDFVNWQNYFEELLSVRDSQLARVQGELQALASENEVQRKSFEAQRKSLEDIILELQAQV